MELNYFDPAIVDPLKPAMDDALRFVEGQRWFQVIQPIKIKEQLVRIDYEDIEPQRRHCISTVFTADPEISIIASGMEIWGEPFRPYVEVRQSIEASHGQGIDTTATLGFTPKLRSIPYAELGTRIYRGTQPDSAVETIWMQGAKATVGEIKGIEWNWGPGTLSDWDNGEKLVNNGVPKALARLITLFVKYISPATIHWLMNAMVIGKLYDEGQGQNAMDILELVEALSVRPVGHTSLTKRR